MAVREKDETLMSVVEVLQLTNSFDVYPLHQRGDRTPDHRCDIKGHKTHDVTVVLFGNYKVFIRLLDVTLDSGKYRQRNEEYHEYVETLRPTLFQYFPVRYSRP